MRDDAQKSSGSLTFFSCGRGDTILVCSGCETWGLIDCNLTVSSNTRRRLEEAITANRVKELQFVCLTHPHKDHFHGMPKLLEECFGARAFHEGGGKFKEFWDTGVLGTVWPLMLRGRETGLAAEVEDLIKLVMPLVHDDQIDYRILNGDRAARVGFGEFYIHCLAPRMNRIERFRHHTVDEIRKSSEKDFVVMKEEVNNLSAVLAFVHKKTHATILLSSDATIDTWEEALQVWHDLTNKKRRFDAVEVSHHGAKPNLYSDLYADWCVPDTTVAILSVGPKDPNHPHEDVLRMLRKCRIEPYFTCRRESDVQTQIRSDLLIGDSQKSQSKSSRFPVEPDYVFADLEVIIQEDGPLKVVEHRS